ncbi:hypothetical protein PCA20602_02704 [Pandoraea capi]|uniref:Uncharacterized protein n=1 Tax=Pandoraea capi TaxID=2508286 RepID=A0ABY6W260_9BURK|nr:hypothetical protein PCA20602_02704 [Pandoraea capi]
MKSAARLSVFSDQGREGNAAETGMGVVDAAERFRSSNVSTLSVTFAKDGSISHRVNVLPEHRAPLAAWLISLAARVGGAD